MPTSNFSQSDYLIRIVAIISHTRLQTVQIQISWLLQKPTDLELHCLQRWGISGFSRTRVNFLYLFFEVFFFFFLINIFFYLKQLINSILYFFPQDIEQVSKEYLGKEIYVGWPHLYEAKVIRVCNEEER